MAPAGDPSPPQTKYVSACDSFTRNARNGSAMVNVVFKEVMKREAKNFGPGGLLSYLFLLFLFKLVVVVRVALVCGKLCFLLC
jgi:hypothetical protein